MISLNLVELRLICKGQHSWVLVILISKCLRNRGPNRAFPVTFQGLELPVVTAVQTISKDNCYVDNVYINKILLDINIPIYGKKPNHMLWILIVDWKQLRHHVLMIVHSSPEPSLPGSRLCHAHIHPSQQTRCWSSWISAPVGKEQTSVTQLTGVDLLCHDKSAMYKCLIKYFMHISLYPVLLLIIFILFKLHTKLAIKWYW